jgi:hypothetical protein
MSRFFILTAFLILNTLSNCVAQDLVTDRPDFTESALVVPSKMIQLESGVEFEDLNSVSTFSYPSVLARIGIGHNFEVRLGFSGWLNEKIDGNSNTYLNDMILEAKYQMTSSDAKIPMAFVIVSTLPTGDEHVSVEAVELGVKYACSYDLNERMGLGANIGAISVKSASDRKILSFASIASGIAVNEKLSAFIELLAEIPESESWQPVINGGFTYLITPGAQADLYLGKGLNMYGADLIIGGGFSFRFGF